MKVSNQLEKAKATDLWTNVSGGSHLAFQAYTYQNRLTKSQLRNDSGSERVAESAAVEMESSSVLIVPKPSVTPQKGRASSNTSVISSSSKGTKHSNQHSLQTIPETFREFSGLKEPPIDIKNGFQGPRLRAKNVTFEKALIHNNSNFHHPNLSLEDSEAASTPKHSNTADREKKIDAEAPTRASSSREPGKFTNTPHPSLELPLFYYLLKHFPFILELIKKIYHFRWSVSYPLQKRVWLSNYLRKANIHMTWGELILLVPLFGMMIVGTLYTFAYPSVSTTGVFARLPLMVAVGSAVRNSILTLLLGMPFERALWYHKLAGRIAFLNGIFHTYIAYVRPVQEHKRNDISVFGILEGFAFCNVINSSGTCILVLMAGIVLTSLPYVRHKFFELFYFVHIVFVAIMALCAFYHSGITVPVVAGVFWGTDLIIRKIIMAYTLYPRKATVSVVSDTVVEVSFPKTKGFSYNPGQFIYIAIPQLSIFEWHPFSISSCPMQSNVTIHIRKVGTWTSALHDLAKKKPTEISILLEGPYGSPCVDIMGNRYKNILLFSGGIGITPIQSISNQLIYEYSKQERELKRLTLVWIERDPALLEGNDVVRRSSSIHNRASEYDMESALGGMFEHGDDESSGIASTLLSLVPVDHTTDHQLALDYPMEDSEGSFRGYVNVPSPQSSRGKSLEGKQSDTDSTSGHEEDGTIVTNAYQTESLNDVLDLQVYLTSNDRNRKLSKLPFVRLGRPDIKQIFAQMREQALFNGEKRVAVYVCAPARLAQICRKSCVKFSDNQVRFDFHVEGPE